MGKKKFIMISLLIISLFLNSACSMTTGNRENERNDSLQNNQNIILGTEWNNNKPGLYGVNQNFTEWERLEEKGIFEIKKGKLCAEIWEEDPGTSASDLTGILIIPNTVTSIGERTFDSCPALLKVLILGCVVDELNTHKQIAGASCIIKKVDVEN